MNLIKLDATTSTNDYLKQLYAIQVVPNFTVVTASQQTSGKGQRGARWESEPAKNLLMSVLVKEVLVAASQVFDLNVAVSVAVVRALQVFKIKKVAIKWPNDIMSESLKIGGILLENNFKSGGEIVSFVGIGLNVNQTNFDSLPHASSLQLQMKQPYAVAALRDEITKQLRLTVAQMRHQHSADLWQQYHQVLFKRHRPMPFENQNGNRFMGIIQEVDHEGKLNVLLDDDTIQRYGLKEIQMLY